MSFLQNPMKTTEIKTVKHLETVLNTKIEVIHNIIENIDKFYYERKEAKLDKKGNIKIKNGQPQYRIIHPSQGELKILQTAIHKRILSKITLPINVKGGVKGNDNISNAKVHQGNKFKFVTDLENFYPSVSYEEVVKMFIRNGFSKKIAIILSRLTTFNNFLPQGTPTSGSIANLVFVPIDLVLLDICKQNTLTYTRYVDDLSFSSKIDFQYHCNTIIETIIKMGFKISRKKTFYKSGKIEITGVIVGNNSIHSPQRVNDKIKSLKESTKVNDEISNTQKGLENYANRIKKLSKTQIKDIPQKNSSL